MIRSRLAVTVADGPGGGWSDDGLLDITRDAEGVEEDLRSEKRYMDDLVSCRCRPRSDATGDLMAALLQPNPISCRTAISTKPTV